MKLISTLLLLALAVGASNPSAAAIIQIEVATTVSQIDAPDHTLPIMVGDEIVVRFQWDDSVPDLNPIAGTGQFQNAILQASVEFPDQMLSFEFPAGGSSVLTTVDNQGGSGLTLDLFGFNSLGDSVTGDTLDGDTPNSMIFGFAQALLVGNPDLVVNDRLNPPFSFDGLGASVVSLSGPIGTTGQNFTDTFVMSPGTAIVVPVPEPALGALALVSIFGLVRRRTWRERSPRA